jgi:hypothetical protein
LTGTTWPVTCPLCSGFISTLSLSSARSGRYLASQEQYERASAPVTTHSTPGSASAPAASSARSSAWAWGERQDCGVERAARSRQIVGEAAAAEQQVGVFQARQNGRSPLTVTRCMTRRWPW